MENLGWTEVVGSLGLLLALGCGTGTTGATGESGCKDADCPTSGTNPSTGGPGDGVDDGVDDAVASTDGGSTPGDTTTTDPDPTGGTDDGQIPCAVQEVLNDNCWMCHDAQPVFGAPMPLTELQDFEVPSVSDNTEAVHARVLARINDDAMPMPAAGMLPDAERSVLDNWINDGRPSEPVDDCGLSGSSDDGGEPIDAPCDDPLVFTAHAAGNEDGFHVPLVDDLYQCFVVASPFPADDQGIAWAPVIDDERVVHHMLLLTASGGGYTPGELISNCSGLTLGTNMLMGWGPGGGVYEMPEEAGLELPDPGDTLILQVHYNNAAAYDDAIDGSGFAVCATDEPRENAAATLWLGTTSIGIPPNSMGTASGSCNTSGLPQSFNVLTSWPHMHQHGRQFITDITRVAGGVDPLVTVGAYNFDSQIYYPHSPSIEVQPGDVLNTTCTYDNTSGSFVGFGEGTAEEMCFNFATVYPISIFNPIGRQCLGGPF